MFSITLLSVIQMFTLEGSERLLNLVACAIFIFPINHGCSKLSHRRLIVERVGEVVLLRWREWKKLHEQPWRIATEC